MKFHKTLITTILLAALTLCLGGCGNRQLRERFDTVERVVTDRPDSALALLREIPDPSRLGTADRARYDLLMAEARYMADSIDTVPTRLLDVAAYFDSENDSHNAARAYYYAGIQTRQKGDYGKAIICFLKAEKQAEKHENLIFLGKIHRQIADCYDDNMDYASALTFYASSMKYFTEANDPQYIGYAILDLARAYYSISDFPNAEKYAKNALKYGETNKQEHLLASASKVLMQIYIEQRHFTEAIDASSVLMRFGSKYIEPEDYRNLGIAYFFSGDIPQAKKYNLLLKQFDTTDNILDFHLSRKDGNYKRALEIYEENVKDQNSAVANMWQRYSANLIPNYYKIEEERNEVLHNRNTLGWIILAVVLIFIITTILFIGHSRFQRIKASNQIILMQIERFKEDLEMKDKDIRELSEIKNENARELEEIRSLFIKQLETGEIVKTDARLFLEQQFSLIGKLSEIINTSVDDHKRIGKMMQQMRDYLKGFSSEESLKNLEISINTHLDNILIHFYEDFPDATFLERTIFIFCILKFSSPAIAFILNTETQTVYNRKSRLKKKLENSPKPRALLYLKYLLR